MLKIISYVWRRTFLFLATRDWIRNALDDLFSFISFYQRLGAIFLVTIHRHHGSRILLFIILKPILFILLSSTITILIYCCNILSNKYKNINYNKRRSLFTLVVASFSFWDLLADVSCWRWTAACLINWTYLASTNESMSSWRKQANLCLCSTGKPKARASLLSSTPSTE